ncbi:DUF3299 domain-containing protein [Pleionea sp. CnH1-48]|uniref:DUF3299 domain-containing protein n=1 Tax=Pleionea sp. CnH1-48 TaxID=2954494 RepID=UPI002097770C|nr:DUF3299 domain-containing protein [Pleionea sp. CnH1-48]MCO7224265.1 DUF3299 domain-containing protein [Pleionea sp. CnH1-48]
MIKRITNWVALGFFILMLPACEKTSVDVVSEQAKVEPEEGLVELDTVQTTDIPAENIQTAQAAVSYKTVEWVDLIPEDDLNALLEPPSYITDVEDGSPDDQIDSQIQNAIASANDDRYQQALASTRIMPEMNNQTIRIPGFIVPLEFNEQQAVTQFFLVPFFGACIHVPPPPPNQIIFVDYPQGLDLESLYEPFWISGTLTTSLIENEMATAAYRMQMNSYEVYTDME